MKQITVKDESGKAYTLEYTKNIIMHMERQGFDLDKMEAQPVLQTTLLVYGAFMKNHASLKQEKIDEIFKLQKNKNGLLKALIEMYNEQGDELVDEGNAEWEANW